MISTRGLDVYPSLKVDGSKLKRVEETKPTIGKGYVILFSCATTIIERVVQRGPILKSVCVLSKGKWKGSNQVKEEPNGF